MSICLDIGTLYSIQNFEDATRVPLLIHVPDVTTKGIRTRAFVELIDLFPTLTELAGLSVPPTCLPNSNVRILFIVKLHNNCFLVAESAGLC